MVNCVMLRYRRRCVFTQSIFLTNFVTSDDKQFSLLINRTAPWPFVSCCVIVDATCLYSKQFSDQLCQERGLTVQLADMMYEVSRVKVIKLVLHIFQWCPI